MKNNKDIFAKETLQRDDEYEISIRPSLLDQLIGQDDIKKELNIFITASKKRNESLDHVLFYGPPGLGKTTLAHIISKEMDSGIKVSNGSSLTRPGDLAAILSTLNPGDVFFIDEIHRMNIVVQEVLYSAMEDYSISLVIGKGVEARTLTIDLPPFTLIGATTDAGLLSAPLRDRFGILFKMNYYTPDDILKILFRTSEVLNFPIELKAAYEISLRSRGTPRIANRLYRRVRDYAMYNGKTIIDLDSTKQAMDFLQIDELGLDETDRLILKTMILRYEGKPVSMNSVATAIGESPENVIDVYEPYLVQIGLINRTPKGRVATKKAYEHLNLSKEQ